MYAKGTSWGQVHNIDTEEDFETIQAAIDDPDTKDGHTISVDAGIYPKPGISPKPIVINKQLKLIGENKETTIIDGDGSGNCIKVTADNVEICGFTIRNGKYGVYLESSNCRVIDNKITSIDFDGIFLSNSVNNTIAHNSISKVKRRGIRLSSSSNNLIHDNDLSENDEGIVLFASPDNSIYHNNFIDNRNQAKDNRDTNRWDKGREEGGNYWYDHKCTGNPSDGTQQYDISVRGATDFYPFMDKDGWTCTLPSPPTLTDPGTNDTDGNYTVSWSSVSSATNYTLEEDTSSSFSTPTKIYSGSETSKEISGKSDGTYYYQVMACNECGCSDWSNIVDINIGYITIDTIPPTVNISYPTNGETFNTTTITVNGNASDNVAVSKVEVKVGSESWQTASGTTSWNRSVTLVPGSNTIYAKAADRSGNTKNTSVTVICDITPSDIYHESITNATEGENISIFANITDDTTKVASATLFYRITGEEVWITISMDHIDDNYSATIPASHVTTAGVEYYIEAVDDVLNTANKPATAPEKPYSIAVTVINTSIVTIFTTSTINSSEIISGNIIHAHSANVTLTFTSPTCPIFEGTTTSAISGCYHFLFTTNEEEIWRVNATWAGDSDTVGNTSKTVSFTVNKSKINVGYAIIIAGRRDDNLSHRAIDLSANNAYKVLSRRGFTPERIFYLNPRMEHDADLDGEYDVDKISSRTNIGYAINTWAQGNVSIDVPLLIYMVGHGENDTFIVNGANNLTASDLNNYLDQITDTTGCQYISIVYDASHSGSFIDNLSRCGRVIVTSVDTDTEAIYDNVVGVVLVIFQIKVGHFSIPLFYQIMFNHI